MIAKKQFLGFKTKQVRNQIFKTIHYIHFTGVLEDSGELTNDLSGVMKLQRRLSMMERDLGAIQAKLDALKAEADEIAIDKPQQAMVIRQDIERIQHVWDLLNRKVREHEAKLDEAGDLQRFLRDLDHFQAWLSATQRQVASEEERKNYI